jgi:tetratricopeptide (TPR) repeat protein
MKTLSKIVKACWNGFAAALSGVIGAALSNRGLALVFLAASVVLITGPWLRSSVSRDFRGVHIPWNDATGRFLPEYVVEAPREWRVDSIATPLLAIVAVGVVVVLLKPKWNSHVFGLLLALSIPALAVTLWNHPGLFEFFESEIRGRAMVRSVFRQVNDDLMSVRAPDRLQSFGGQLERRDLLEPQHPMLTPFQYWMYGGWLVAAAFVATMITRRDSWPGRFAYAAYWTGAGVLLAAAATWPRWVAEYHWARAENLEAVNQLEDAEHQIDQALRTMPDLAATRRYWLAKGRLGYRQRETGEHVSFFLAHQYLRANELDRARAELDPWIGPTGGATPQRDLLAEIIGYTAIRYVNNDNHGAAELAWEEASAAAPWKPTYWVAEAATILNASPQRAPEVEARLLSKLVNVGDCFVGADFATTLGDAYFETGNFVRARELYNVAMDIFDLPKYVNLHAQEGKLGM